MKSTKSLEELQSVLSDLSKNKLVSLFSNLSSNELEVFLDLLKNLDFYKIKIENLPLLEDELKKYLLINLALRNEIRAEVKDLKTLELNIINYLKSQDLAEAERKGILTTYVIKGLHILILESKNKKYFDEFKYKKLALKYLHDIGGFQPGIWGININYDSFDEFINNIDEKTLEKLESKNNKISINDFVMLKNLLDY